MAKAVIESWLLRREQETLEPIAAVRFIPEQISWSVGEVFYLGFYFFNIRACLTVCWRLAHGSSARVSEAAEGHGCCKIVNLFGPCGSRNGSIHLIDRFYGRLVFARMLWTYEVISSGFGTNIMPKKVNTRWLK